MKELSIEEKSKRYDEALDEAKAIHKAIRQDLKSVIEQIFPELKESEDERIRKQIISFLKGFECDHYRCLDFSSWIAWLEKQGKQNVDKVEPKFKVGDWIVFNGLTLLVNEVVQGYYRTISKGGIPNSYDWGIDYAARLWTIEDAKDGDLLVASDGSIFIYKCQRNNSVVHYIAVTSCNDLVINKNNYSWENKNACHPATKEQCNLLFKRIQEYGYEWDADKKKLIKL